MSARPTLLVVDDEPHVLSALERTLRREPYDVVVARSGEEALARIDAGGISAVLSDQRMPDISGIRLLEEIRARSPEVARLLLTGLSESLSRPDLDVAGVAAVIPKPWEQAELRQRIAEAMHLVGER